MRCNVKFHYLSIKEFGLKKKKKTTKQKDKLVKQTYHQGIFYLTLQFQIK